MTDDRWKSEWSKKRYRYGVNPPRPVPQRRTGFFARLLNRIGGRCAECGRQKVDWRGADACPVCGLV
jgi:rubrerythrin